MKKTLMYNKAVKQRNRWLSYAGTRPCQNRWGSWRDGEGGEKICQSGTTRWLIIRQFRGWCFCSWPVRLFTVTVIVSVAHVVVSLLMSDYVFHQTLILKALLLQCNCSADLPIGCSVSPVSQWACTYLQTVLHLPHQALPGVLYDRELEERLQTRAQRQRTHKPRPLGVGWWREGATPDFDWEWERQMR